MLGNFLHTYLLTYLLIYLLTPWSRVLLEKLNVSQLIKKFPAFYGTRRFIAKFTRARHLSLILSQIDPFHANTSNFLKFHLNIILPSTPGSSMLSLFLRFPHQTPVYALLHTCHMSRPSHSYRFDHPSHIW